MTDIEHSRCRLAALVFALSLLVPRLCFADNLGSIGKGLGILVLGALLSLGVMVVFIVLALVLRSRAKARKRGGAKALVIATRALAVLWYLLVLSPIIDNLVTVHGHDVGWLVLFCVVLGAPAHIPSIVALVMASRLARVDREG